MISKCPYEDKRGVEFVKKQEHLSEYIVTYPPRYKISDEFEGWTEGVKISVFTSDDYNTVSEKYNRLFELSVIHQDRKIYEKLLLKRQKKESELKVVIDTLQTTLGRALSVLPEDVYDYVITKASLWALQFGKETK